MGQLLNYSDSDRYLGSGDGIVDSKKAFIAGPNYSIEKVILILLL